MVGSVLFGRLLVRSTDRRMLDWRIDMRDVLVFVWVLLLALNLNLDLSLYVGEIGVASRESLIAFQS